MIIKTALVLTQRAWRWIQKLHNSQHQHGSLKHVKDGPLSQRIIYSLIEKDHLGDWSLEKACCQ